MTEPNTVSTIFVHIPKTAGTTLRAIIEDHYPENRICLIYQGNLIHLWMDDFKKFSNDNKKKFQIFCGHFEFGLHRQIPQPCRYITVLRDPTDRVTSLYQHHLNEKHKLSDKVAGNLQDQLKTGAITLEDFVSSGISLQTDNCQTRYLAGEAPEFGQCTKAMLEKAKQNLREHFVVTGLTERFDESVLLMQKALGWSPPYYVKKNISSERTQKKTLDPATRDIILRYNELDTELYNFALERLDEQIAKQGDSFRNELEEFRAANRLFQEKSRKWLVVKRGQEKIRNLKRLLQRKSLNFRK